jgi:hypothetical protein
VEIVDLDLLLQSPKKYKQNIGGKGAEGSSKGSTMELRNKLKNIPKTLGKNVPFYRGSQIWPLGSFPTFWGWSRSNQSWNRSFSVEKTTHLVFGRSQTRLDRARNRQKTTIMKKM